MLVVTVFDRSSISNVLCRAVFVVGSPGTNKTLQEELDDEKERHEDVIQTDFLDTYRHVCVWGRGMLLVYRWYHVIPSPSTPLLDLSYLPYFHQALWLIHSSLSSWQKPHLQDSVVAVVGQKVLSQHAVHRQDRR